MFYVYVLKSIKDNKLYIGYSSDLRQRLSAYNQGKSLATKNRRPFELIYYEAYTEMSDAKNREIFLKSGSGHKYLKKQLNNYFLNRNS